MTTSSLTPVPSPIAPEGADALALPVKAQKIGFVHLGCPKNLVDTETMLGALTQDGHTIVADESEADVVLVNTCAFIEKAQAESVEALAQLAEQGKKLLIAGCLAQKFQGDLLTLFPEAQAVVGTHHVGDIARILRQSQQGERVLAIQQDPDYLLQEDHQRRHITSGAWAYVKIAEGCDYRCSFCIIPSLRGAFRSRPLQNVVENARSLAQSGVREIILVGQDATSYGKEFGLTLADLLRALNTVDGLDWIRVMYAYPTLVSDDLLTAIAECDRVVKYLDCPLQHSHPDILRRMRRPSFDVEAFADRARARIPGVALRSSFIVGFPGETQAHFEHLQGVLQRARFERLGVFEYSDVEGADSRDLDGKVAKKEIAARRRTLMAAQQGIAYAHNQALVGQTLAVLIDSQNSYGQLIGRTAWDAPEVDNSVLLKDPDGQTLPGDLVQARVTSAGPYDLKGVVVA
ncbi:MAG: 30S ribosomal protein S12 methylthiotransferase RimO [Vampirovibrionales bacterium]|nr:30S ribosomal protein S12 methylthiotransferase RimO [Vampirovibrionales bacterium]